MVAAKFGFEGIRGPVSASSAAAATHKSAFRQARRFPHGREEPVHTSAQGGLPPPILMRRRLLQVRTQSVFAVKCRSYLLLMRGDAACDHRFCAGRKPSQRDHEDMNKQKQHQGDRDKEVNGTSRLTSAQQSN